MMNTPTTILTIALAAICSTGYAANNNLVVTDTVQTEEVLTIAQEMPVFPGGDSAMYEYIFNNIVYPVEVIDKKLAGKVFVQFVINKNGEVANPRIARGIDPMLDNEIIRVVQNMPKWTPGKNNGESVNVVKTIPISFKNEPQPEETARDINLSDSSYVVLFNPETNAWDTVYSTVDEMPEYTSNEPEMGMNIIPILRYLNVDEMPDFTSSEHRIKRDIATHVRYPKEAKKEKIEGSVLVQFVVDEKGEIGNISIIKSTNPIFNEEAIRAVKTLPGKFKPGKNQGKPVKILYAIPIIFYYDIPHTSIFTYNNINPTDSCHIVLFNQETYAWDTIWVKYYEFELPEYPGGESGLLQYIATHTKYPKQARKLKISGKVFVDFMVNDKGDVENVRIAEGVHPLLDAEAIRVVESIPKKFKPGRYQGTPVKVPFTLPINFRLH